MLGEICSPVAAPDLARTIKVQAKKGQIKKTQVKKPCMSKSRIKRTKIVERLWNAAELQVCEIEERLQIIDSTNIQFERDARSLGLLAKFLKELVSLEAIMNAAKNSAKVEIEAEIENKDVPPRNLEQFRLELEKRLDAMRKGRQPAATGDTPESALAGGAAG